MTSTHRPYRGVSAAERQAERRIRLASACLEVIDEGGLAGVTVEAVCSRAGLTNRYLYEGFGDREGLLTAVADTMYATVARAVLDAVDAAGPEPAARARATVDAVVATLQDDPGLARLYVESPGNPALLARRDAAVDTFADLLLEHVLGVAADDRSRLVAGVVVAGTTHAVTQWLTAPAALDRQVLVDAIAGAGMAALGA